MSVDCVVIDRTRLAAIEGLIRGGASGPRADLPVVSHGCKRELTARELAHPLEWHQIPEVLRGDLATTLRSVDRELPGGR